MRTPIFLAILLTFTTNCFAQESDGWIQLFNGKDLTGWKANEDPDTFRVEGGKLIVNGNRSHLFYVGPVADANFKNFEWRCKVMLKPGSNSGMYFHTKFLDEGWPHKGYEVQLNNTQHDSKKTGGLYAIADVIDNSPAKDDVWFTQSVTVKGKRIIVKVDGKVTTDYTEPDSAASDPDRYSGRLLSSGTFALQGHDPGSTAIFEKIEVRLLD